MRQKLELIRNISIRMNFEDKDAEKFITIKTYMGLKQNTEVIRALISQKYNEIRHQEQKQRNQREIEERALEWLEKGKYTCPM
jgi:hypothetical protein